MTLLAVFSREDDCRVRVLVGGELYHYLGLGHDVQYSNELITGLRPSRVGDTGNGFNAVGWYPFGLGPPVVFNFLCYGYLQDRYLVVGNLGAFARPGRVARNRCHVFQSGVGR